MGPGPLTRRKRAQFDRIAELARATAGLKLVPEKAAMVLSRVGKRLRALELRDEDAYLAHLNGPNGSEERTQLIGALTTNVTGFFRENHHFTHFAKEHLPALIARARRGARLRFWSSACSSGQEPYSLAMVLLETFPDISRHDVKILATDIDTEILKKARAGRYSRDHVSTLGPRRDRFFASTASGDFEIGEPVRSLVSFRHLNLMGDWPMKGRFDAIFCRNVMIYFDEATQARLIGRLAEACVPGAMLYLGHSERMHPDYRHAFRQVTQTGFAFHSPLAHRPGTQHEVSHVTA